MSIPVQNADPCHHCRAKLFAEESKGVCCNNGKYVLPPLPPLPPVLAEMYTFNEPWARQLRKDSRAYNYRSNFASMNIE
ncbi:unnamed protein product, partial [Ectocarpus sp. 12 AP-2014]